MAIVDLSLIEAYIYAKWTLIGDLDLELRLELEFNLDVNLTLSTLAMVAIGPRSEEKRELREEIF